VGKNFLKGKKCHKSLREEKVFWDFGKDSKRGGTLLNITYWRKLSGNEEKKH